MNRVPEIQQPRRICIIQERVPDYRVEFFEGLRRELAANGCELVLIVPQKQSSYDASKADGGELEWVTTIDAKRRRLFGYDLTYLPILSIARSFDLVVVEHALRLVHTYLLLLMGSLRLGSEVAWWGHGADLGKVGSARLRDRIAQRLLAWLTPAADMALAYTDGSAKRFIAAGMAPSDVKVVQNTVPCSWHDQLPDAPGDSLVCAYMGSLYEEKRIDVLFQAADLIREDLDGFTLRILGDGPLRTEVEDFASSRPWVHFHGRQTGAQTAALLADVKFILNPGLVGLVAVDSLRSGRPIITIFDSMHSPEFEYLTPGVNSIVVPGGGSKEFAEAVLAAVVDREMHRQMAESCRTSGQRYTLDAMIGNFSGAIIARVGSSSRR